MKWLWASDIDNTLTGDRPALDHLGKIIHEERSKGDLFFILCTGRRLEQVIDGQKTEGIPEADAVICQVGTEIYLAPFKEGMAPLKEWDELLRARYSRIKALEFLKDIEGLMMQPDKFNTDLKTSCYLDTTPDPEAAAQKIIEKVAPDNDSYRVIWSSGRDLDILPAKAGKGNAIQFLIEHLALGPDRTVVSGDSGNDSDMFRESFHGIAVGNARPELKEFLEKLSHNKTYLAKKEFAAGIEEGLHHFKIV